MAGLHSEYSRDSWGFIPTEHSKGQGAGPPDPGKESPETKHLPLYVEGRGRPKRLLRQSATTELIEGHWHARCVVGSCEVKQIPRA